MYFSTYLLQDQAKWDFSRLEQMNAKAFCLAHISIALALPSFIHIRVFQALGMLVSPNTMLLGWRGEFTHWKQTPHHRHRDSASQKLLVLFAHVPLFVWLTLCGIKQSAMIAYRWSLSLHVQNCRAVKRERTRTSRSWLFILSNVPHISVHHMSISKCLLVAVQTCRSLAFSPGAIRRAQAYGRAPRLKLIFQALSRGWKVQIYKRQWSTVDLVQLKPE